MKLKPHIISAILLGLCSFLVVDMAAHVFMGLQEELTQHSHVIPGEDSPAPGLVEENVAQEYITPEDVFEGHNLPNYIKTYHFGQEKSVYEHSIIVPPPDYTS